MNTVISIHCTVNAGKLEFDRAQFAKQLQAAKDGNYTMTIEPRKEGLTHQQRKYFFGVIIPILQAGFAEIGTSVTKEQIRLWLKDKFLFREAWQPITHSFAKEPISLGNNDKAIPKDEFTKYKEQIQQWAAEHLHIVIPDPNQMEWTE